MPFVRFSRDRRGYEHTYLLHIDHKRGQSQARVLYWFRTPPNVQVGREVFDADTRHRLEAAHPDVIFDWAALTKSLETTVDQLRAGGRGPGAGDRGSGIGDRARQGSGGPRQGVGGSGLGDRGSGGKQGKRKARGKGAAAPPVPPPSPDEPQL